MQASKKTPMPGLTDVHVLAQRQALDDHWQRFGAQTQVAASSTRRSPLTLVIGLDFGTAYTKVVIGEGQGRVRYAVPFDALLKLRNRYLMPSLLATDASGGFHLGQSEKMQKYHHDIKMKLLMGQDDETTRLEAVAFMALVLRYTRYWFFQTHGNAYARHRLEWWLNIGLPSDSWEKSRLSDAYQNMALAAWRLSVADAPIQRETVQQVWRNPETLRLVGEPFDHPDYVAAIPEFVAQITPYVKSTRKQNDLHLLVDVGAGTLDVTTFNAHEWEGEDVFPIFEARVERLGSRYYVAQLLADRQGSVRWDEEESSADLARFAQSAGLTRPDFQSRTRQFQNQVKTTIQNVLNMTRSHRYIKSPHWIEGIPTFLCGGGSSIPLYRSVLQTEVNQTLRLTSLEKPDSFKADDLPSTDFHRLSVACGLSFSAADIGTIRPRSQVPDDVPVMTKQKPQEFAMCPACRGSGNYGSCYKCGGSGFA